MLTVIQQVFDWTASTLNLTGNMIPSAVLILTWMGIVRATRYSGWKIALISLPGTWLHEISHLLVGILLFAKPASFSIWPKREGKQWVLGSVGFTNLNVWNAVFVALAPLSLLGIAWGVFQFWMMPAFNSANYLSWIAAGYAVSCCMFSAIPSTTDIKAGAPSGLMYGGVSYAVWYFVR